MFRSPLRDVPPALRRRQRLGWRVAAGVAPDVAAAAEGLSEDEARELLGCYDFQELIEAAAELQALTDEQRIERLKTLAYQLIERAMLRGDVRAAVFVMAETRLAEDAKARARGRGDPARVLAESALEAVARKPSPPPPEPQERERTAYAAPMGLAEACFHPDPLAAEAAICRRARAALRPELIDEHRRCSAARRHRLERRRQEMLQRKRDTLPAQPPAAVPPEGRPSHGRPVDVRRERTPRQPEGP